jgi:hypothetical protein
MPPQRVSTDRAKTALKPAIWGNHAGVGALGAPGSKTFFPVFMSSKLIVKKPLQSGQAVLTFC